MSLSYVKSIISFILSKLQNVVRELTNCVKMRLDNNLHQVGLDTTLKKRGGNFIPFNLKAEYACQQMPKNIDDMISGNLGLKRADLYLHKLVCYWKTCPDINCCSDDLIKELRNEIFNALFR